LLNRSDSISTQVSVLAQQAIPFNRKAALNHHQIDVLFTSAGSLLYKQSPDQTELLHLSQAMHGVLKFEHSFNIATKRLENRHAAGNLFEQVEKGRVHQTNIVAYRVKMPEVAFLLSENHTVGVPVSRPNNLVAMGGKIYLELLIIP
jgi:hypothetical protein